MGTPRDHSGKPDWIPGPPLRDGMRSDAGADKFGDREERKPSAGLRNNPATTKRIRKG